MSIKVPFYFAEANCFDIISLQHALIFPITCFKPRSKHFTQTSTLWWLKLISWRHFAYLPTISAFAWRQVRSRHHWKTYAPIVPSHVSSILGHMHVQSPRNQLSRCLKLDNKYHFRLFTTSSAAVTSLIVKIWRSWYHISSRHFAGAGSPRQMQSMTHLRNRAYYHRQ